MRTVRQQQVVQPSSKTSSLVPGNDGQFGDLEAVVEPVSGLGAIELCRHRLAPPSAGDARVAVRKSDDYGIDGRDAETEIRVSGVTKHSRAELVDPRATRPEHR